jgi:hypothetical protein
MEPGIFSMQPRSNSVLGDPEANNRLWRAK